MTEEQQKDEQVLAAIIAGGVASGRAIRPAGGHTRRGRGRGHFNAFGVGPYDSVHGPACAVGAGVLFAGMTIVADAQTAFAKIHGVSRAYARGVSDGFEYGGCGFYACAGDRYHEEYTRGVVVGEAAFDYFGATGRVRTRR